MQLHTLEADTITTAATVEEATQVAILLSPDVLPHDAMAAYVNYVFGARAEEAFPAGTSITTQFTAAWEAARRP